MAVASSKYDMCCVLIGKTGIGKSTTGNKIIGHYDDPFEKTKYEGKMKLFYSKLAMGLRNENDPYLQKQQESQCYFDEGDLRSTKSTTDRCKLVANNYLKVCVLDVRGFSDTSTYAEKGVSLEQANLRIMREIVRNQLDLKLTFNRIVYFLPDKGTILKADAAGLQQEIYVMHYFFGEEVFKSMVLVVTVNPLDYEDDDGGCIYQLTSKKIQHIQNVFKDAFKFRLKKECKICPPVVFIAKSDSGEEVREKLKSTAVTRPTGLTLNFVDDVCVKCAGKTRYAQTRQGEYRTGFCIGDGSLIDCTSSKCHPKIIPKHSTLVKICNGVLYLLTFGQSPALFGTPDFSCSEEVCINCKRAPGSPGCLTYNESYYTSDGVKITVKHENKMEKFENAEDL